MLKIKFGKAHRGPGSYDEVVARYIEKLEVNKNVVGRFSSKMPEPTYLEKDHWVSLLTKQNEKNKTYHRTQLDAKITRYLPSPPPDNGSNVSLLNAYVDRLSY